MKKEIESYNAKTKLPEILRRVEEGDSFTITKRGKPIADLIPSRSGSRKRAAAAIKCLLENPHNHVITTKELSALEDSGRK